jgi:hypothetical protein
MKKLFFFSLLISSLIYSQAPTKNILNLKHESKNLTITDNNFSNKLQKDFHKKNLGLAIIYSLLLPGMGELYAGNYSSGKYFTIADALLWGSYIGFDVYGNIRKNDYKSFAASNGGINNSGKDAAYYTTVGNYISIQQYNDEKALERNFSDMYNVDKYYWDWKTNAQRSTYRNMWTSSESAYNNLRFVAGALILNRIVSIINVVRLVNDYNNRQQGDELGWNVSVGVDNSPTHPTNLSFNFQTKF